MNSATFVNKVKELLAELEALRHPEDWFVGFDDFKVEGGTWHEPPMASIHWESLGSKIDALKEELK